jgi:anti-sigma B factor antagonist
MPAIDGAAEHVHERITPESNGVVDVVETDDATRIVVTGDLDMDTARGARFLLEAVCDARPAKVVIDLSRLEFVDSHGLHLLVVTYRALIASGCPIAVVPPPDDIRRAFAIAGLDGLFS